jgi:hypothetical protein
MRLLSWPRGSRFNSGLHDRPPDRRQASGNGVGFGSGTACVKSRRLARWSGWDRSAPVWAGVVSHQHVNGQAH